MASAEQSARVKIFVSAHKRSVIPDAACIVPVQVGAATAPVRFDDMLHDDDGENISALNPMYCELTAQYWAWKNMDADYYGFCHYRRYFDFTETPHSQNDYGEIIDGCIDDRTIAEYGLNDRSINEVVLGWDVITSPINDTHMLDGYQSVKEHWNGDSHLRMPDLRHMYDILCRRHPEYREDADMILNGYKACFCNMFIMRKEIFRDYCEWLFPLLEEFVNEWDNSCADVQTLRTPGHLSERLLNIYLAHHRRMGAGWRTKTLQCVHFTDPDPASSLEPLDRNPRSVVPVVFAADDNYVPMLTTTIYSMLRNADPTRMFDVIVLEKDISEQNKHNIEQFLGRFPNATVRFYDVSRTIAGYELTTNNAHISVETYYRFIIQDALPFYSKILYLDSDLVIDADVTELYDYNLGTAAIGAIRDIDFLGNVNMKDGVRAKYAVRKLNMRNPYDYFQAGVLVMNLDRMRQIHTVSEWLDIASQPGFIYNDQDILNMECEGEVAYLPYEWNVMHDCADRVQGVFAYAPAEVYRAYMASRRAPKIVHYAGFDKPWKNPWCDFGPLYWHYAQETPFSLQMMALLAGVGKPKPKPHHERAIAEDSPIRKYADRMAPSGSKQREVLKTVARKVRGRK